MNSAFRNTLLVLGGIGLVAGIFGTAYGANKTVHDATNDLVNDIIPDKATDVLSAKVLYDADTWTKTSDTKSPIGKLSVHLYRDGKEDLETPFWVIQSLQSDNVSALSPYTIATEDASHTVNGNADLYGYLSGVTFDWTFSDSIALSNWTGYVDVVVKVSMGSYYHKVGERYVPLLKGSAATSSASETSKVSGAVGLSAQKILMAAATDHTATLTATITPSNVTVKTISWTTSDSTKVALSSSSSVSGEAITLTAPAQFDGTVTITATCTNNTSVTASCAVTWAA